MEMRLENASDSSQERNNWNVAVTTTEVEMHPFKTNQGSGMAATQLLNFGFQFWQSNGNVPRLFDVSLAKKKEQIKTADGRWNMVILKNSDNKQKAVAFLSLILEFLRTCGPPTFPVKAMSCSWEKKDYTCKLGQLEQMSPDFWEGCTRAAYFCLMQKHSDSF